MEEERRATKHRTAARRSDYFAHAARIAGTRCQRILERGSEGFGYKGRLLLNEFSRWERHGPLTTVGIR